jgi:hypothetical protein
MWRSGHDRGIGRKLASLPAGFVLSADRASLSAGRNLGGVDMLERLARRVGTGANIALGVVMAAALAFDAFKIARVSGEWPFDSGVGLVICVTALLRGRNRAWAAVIGLAVFGLAAVAAALAIGLWLRYLDHRDRETLEAKRRDERLELARELHDVVAHHVTGIVVQAQAARFTGEERPEPLVSALGSIESAGVETLAAIRQLVGLLRDPDDTSGVSSPPEPIDQLVERFARHGPAVDLRLPADLVSGWPPEVASTVSGPTGRPGRRVPRQTSTAQQRSRGSSADGHAAPGWH